MKRIDPELMQTLTIKGDSGIYITGDVGEAHNQIYELNEKIYELSKSMEDIGADTETLKESFEELSKGLKRLERLNGADTEKLKGSLDFFNLNFDEILAYPIDDIQNMRGII